MSSVQIDTDIPSFPAVDAFHSDTISTLSNPVLKGSFSIPTLSDCIAHLRLLEAFFLLREDISTTDDLYNIRDDFIPPTATEQQKNQLLAKIREKRWAIYVTNASLRFDRWWKTCTGSKGGGSKHKAAPLNLNQHNLPPLGECIALSLYEWL